MIGKRSEVAEVVRIDSEKTMNKTAATITILLALAACTADDIFADDAGDSETGGAFECLDPQTTSTPDGRTWVTDDEWGSWAQAFDAAGLSAALDNGIFEASASRGDAFCWRYGSPTDYGHVCALTAGCYTLHARPSEEIGAGAECDEAPTGPWDYTIMTAFGCWAVFADYGLSVALID